MPSASIPVQIGACFAMADLILAQSKRRFSSPSGNFKFTVWVRENHTKRLTHNCGNENASNFQTRQFRAHFLSCFRTNSLSCSRTSRALSSSRIKETTIYKFVFIKDQNLSQSCIWKESSRVQYFEARSFDIMVRLLQSWLSTHPEIITAFDISRTQF